MTRLTLMTILAASLGATACATEIENPEPGEGNDLPPGSTTGGEDTTFDHDNGEFDPWQIIDRLATEGPPAVSSRFHGCMKVPYATVRNVLTGLGVNMANTAALTPGQLHRDGFNAMGGANFANRIRENTGTTTSGASRLFDIMAAAAPEIITNIATVPRCQVNGVGPVLFDGNTCRADGITCLIGAPAQAGHVDFCNLTVSQATTPDVGKRIAVAALLAAAYTCE